MSIRFVVEGNDLSAKTIANMQEVKARKGPVLAIAPNIEIPEEAADDAFRLPDAHEVVRPILANLPLQLFAYHFARLRGLDARQAAQLWLSRSRWSSSFLKRVAEGIHELHGVFGDRTFQRFIDNPLELCFPLQSFLSETRDAELASAFPFHEYQKIVHPKIICTDDRGRKRP